MPEMKFVIGSGTLKKSLIDQGSGVEIEIEHLLPNNQQRIKYQKDATAVKGKKVVIKSQKAAREHVKPLLVGFRFPDSDPDTWIKVEKEGVLHPISCNADDPGYVKGWRQVLGHTVPNIIESLGNQIFSGAQDADSGIVFDYEEDDPEDEDGQSAGEAEVDPM